jgi:hypothetical protein
MDKLNIKNKENIYWLENQYKEKIGWDGQYCLSGSRFARFVCYDDAVYFAGMHEWEVKNEKLSKTGII